MNISRETHYDGQGHKKSSQLKSRIVCCSLCKKEFTSKLQLEEHISFLFKVVKI